MGHLKETTHVLFTASVKTDRIFFLFVHLLVCYGVAFQFWGGVFANGWVFLLSVCWRAT